jgi:hypothetical protein
MFTAYAVSILLPKKDIQFIRATDGYSFGNNSIIKPDEKII